MALIFAFSSNSNPYRWAAEWLGLAGSVGPGGDSRLLPWLSNETLGMLSHFLEYLVLGLLVNWAVRPGSPRGRWWVWAFCLAFALSDEFHQLFVPERAFQLQDLALDSLASWFGVFLPAHTRLPHSGRVTDPTLPPPHD
jgi:VanZ family protein